LKNITLVFSPFATFTIPLGIAQLKSYVEGKLPTIKITNLDLNNQFFNNLTKKEYLDRAFFLLSSYPEKFNKAESRKYRFLIYGNIFKMSVDFLMDEKSEVFYDIQKYNSFTANISSSWNTWKLCINTIVKEIIEKDLPITPNLENIFKDDIEAIAAGKPDLVGFSIFCQEQLFYSAILAKIIKKKLNLPIIFGGAFMSHIDIKEFLDFFDFVDFAVNQEGEISLVELARNYPSSPETPGFAREGRRDKGSLATPDSAPAIAKTDEPGEAKGESALAETGHTEVPRAMPVGLHSAKSINKVPGLYYRLAGKIEHNPEKFISDLNSLNYPDFSDFKLNGYLSSHPHPVLPIIFSRGCFWKKCAFCTYYKNYPGFYKTKSIKKIIAEIKHYNSKGIKYFVFNDDIISASNLNAISSALKKNKIKIFFGAVVNPERSFSKPILKNIYEAGGRYLTWGLESSCQRILDLMNKGTTIEYAMPAIKYSHEQGFHNHLFMIQGFPTQTEAEISKDLKFLLSNKNIIDSFFIHRFQLFQKSYIFYNPEKFKIKNTRKTLLCKHIKNKNVIHNESVAFKRSNRLDSKKNFIKNITIFSHHFMAQRYNDMEQSHMLLHASR